jgi:hypothetical protein
MVAAFIIMAALAFLLMLEFMRRGFKKAMFRPRAGIYLLSILFFISKPLSANIPALEFHYGFESEESSVITLCLFEGIRFLIFFLVCYYFTKKSTRYLDTHQRWVKVLRWFMVFNLIWIVVVVGFLLKSLNQDQHLCQNIFFVFVRFGGEAVTIIFFIIGLAVTKRVNKLKRATAYEILLKDKQEKALRKMWITITFFMVTCLYLFIYDLALYTIYPSSCAHLSDNEVVNIVLWTASRLVSEILWIIPIFYVFWENPIGL